MNKFSVPMLISQLVEAKLLSPAQLQQFERSQHHSADESVWLKGLMILGAWVASLFLLPFLGLLIWSEQYLAIPSGLGMIAAAAWLSRSQAHEFIKYMALVIGLAGQGIFAVGVWIGLDENIYATLIILILCQIGLIAVNRDRAHQYLSVLAIVAELMILVFVAKQILLVHAIILLLATSLVWLVLFEATLYRSWFATTYAPLKYGVACAVMTVMMLSTVYVLPEVNRYDYFPMPWLSTLSLGAVLMAVVYRIVHALTLAVRESIKIVLYCGVVLVIGCSWQAPGLLLALLLIVLGFYSADRFLMVLSQIFFVVFMTAFFYAIEISLLHKAYTLMALGVVLLLGGYLIHRQRLEHRASQNA